ncbi:YfhO family protein [uncultured Trichococcus sp.]|uniref:YfhO family protein n=1 Tax=uncultured Trichococcus sp. TaxID=189665 RepID=UPI0029C80D94|nr:YfhO family protein [uncultured Trichococcus sp.]
MKQKYSYLGSFLLPVISLLLAYIFIGIYPFGELSLLTIDMYNQYVSFFSYLKSILIGNNDIFYTFSKNLGGDMIGILAYYLMSPFNVVLLFFPLKYFTEAILFLSLLKTGFAGLTMSIWLNRKKASPYSMLFSIAYALMGYMLVYQQNIMWLDGVILLPLVVMGIDRIFENRSFLLYSCFLALSLVTNYYIGYMICIFSVIYVLMKVIGSCKGKSECFRYIANFILGSLLAGGLSAFLLIPTAFSLSGGKAEFNPDFFTFDPNFAWPDFISKFVIGSTNINQIITGFPNVYAGSFVLSGLVFFFLQGNIPIRKRIAYLFGFLVIVASFYFNGINLIWHGLNTPAWFPYRYSFVFVFLAVAAAYEAFLASLEKSINVIQLLLLVTLWVLIGFYMSGRAYDFITGFNAKITYVSLFISAFLLFAFSHAKPNIKRHVFVIMLAFSFFELTFNSHETLKQQAYAPRSEFTGNVEKVQPLTEAILEQDESFYRMAQDFQFNRNDPMLYGYSGLSHYSSNEKTFVKDFLGDIGFRNNGNWAYYGKGNTVTVDSLLAVKYLISSGAEHSHYTSLKSEDNLTVYQNPYALPVGMMVKNQTENLDLAQVDPFAMQNDLFGSIVTESAGDALKRSEGVSIKLENVQQSSNEYGTVYEKIDGSKDAFVIYTIDAAADGPYYAFFPSAYWIPTELYVNDEWIATYFNEYNYNIVPLGDYAQGEEITVTLKINNEKTIVLDELFYYEDLEIVKHNFEDLSSNSFQVDEHTSSSFSGSVESEVGKGTLLFTIPYDEAWQIEVDGELKEGKIAFQTFLAIDLEPGEHTVELKYVPKGWRAGVAITSVSMLIVALISFKARPQKRKH